MNQTESTDWMAAMVPETVDGVDHPQRDFCGTTQRKLALLRAYRTAACKSILMI
jgi:hypothetical protein